MKQAIQLDPNRDIFYTILGTKLHHIGKIDEAIEVFKNGLYSNPGSAELHYNLGKVYIDKGLLEEGLLETKKALTIDPQMTDVKRKVEKLKKLRHFVCNDSSVCANSLNAFM